MDDAVLTVLNKIRQKSLHYHALVGARDVLFEILHRHKEKGFDTEKELEKVLVTIEELIERGIG